MPEAKIHFYSERIAFSLSSPRKTISWLKKICRKERHGLGALAYVFCSDAYLSKLNREYLNHDTFTDIITFDYSEGPLIEGDVYISIPRVRENAKQFGVPFEIELRRVIAHGLLHLLGYDDKNPGQKAQMRRKEEACLSLWK